MEADFLSDTHISERRSCNYRKLRNSVLAVVLAAVGVLGISVAFSKNDVSSEMSKTGVQAMVGSWDDYIDNIVAGSRGNCDAAAIVGLDGSKWTSDDHGSSLKITALETVTLAQTMKVHTVSTFASAGIYIAGTKYFFLRELSDGKMILGKLRNHGSITMMKTATAIIIAHTSEGQQQGYTNVAVTNIGDYLESLNMRRLMRDPYSRRLEQLGAVAVVELGSGKTRAGYAGQDAPKSSQPTVVVQLEKSRYVGDEAIQKRGTLDLFYPIKGRLVENWDYVENIIDYVFYHELRMSEKGEEASLLTEAPSNPEENREKLTQIMFENFEVPWFYLANNAVLATYASGRKTAIVLFIDEFDANVVPVYEGHALPHATINMDFGGTHLTEYFGLIMQQRGTFQLPRAVVEDMKRTLSYAALDFEQEMLMAASSSSCEKSYKMPDGQKITAGNERFRVAEVLFQPSLAGKESAGVHETVYNSIMKCDVGLRADLYSNVIVAGSETFYPGIAERLHKEMTSLVPAGVPAEAKLKIVAPPSRELSTWIGGSILGSLPEFPKMAISRKEYDEKGPSIVHLRCF